MHKVLIPFGVLALVASASAQRMERGSFLVRPAKSLDAMVQQMNKQPGVVKRYADHYGLSKGQIVRYFQGMTPSRIPSTGKYMVYGYQDGRVRGSMQTLTKGEVIYKDADGRLALRASCGNPMTTGAQARRTVGEEMVAATPQAAATAEPEEAMAAAPPSEPIAPPAAEPVVAPAAEPVTATAPVVEPAPVVQVEPTLSAPVQAPEPAIVAGRGNNNLVPILLGIGAVAAIAIVASDDGGDNTPVVPEPASMVVLGLGLAALKRRRKNG